MALIANTITAADTTALVTISEVLGHRIRIHSISGGFITTPAAPRNLGLIYGSTTVGRWPVHTRRFVPFPVELHAPEGDGAGGGTVKVQLGQGGTGVVGYITVSYTIDK